MDRPVTALANRRDVLRIGAACAAFAATLSMAGTGRADLTEFPISLIVPFGRGGFTDITARALAPVLAAQIGPTARVEVVNRPNNGGELAYTALARARADGFTLGFINAPGVLTIPIERTARYSVDSLDPLLLIAKDPSVWSVRQNSPFHTLGDLLAAARAAPGTILVGATGVGTDDDLGIRKLQRQAGVRFATLHFPSSGAAASALLDGRIGVLAHNLAESVQAHGRIALRVLGVMSRERWPVAPELPTFAELGYPVEMASLRGVAAPRGLPPEIRGRLIQALRAAVDDPAFRALAEAPASYQPLHIVEADGFAAELAHLAAELRQLWQLDPWNMR